MRVKSCSPLPSFPTCHTLCLSPSLHHFLLDPMAAESAPSIPLLMSVSHTSTQVTTPPLSHPQTHQLFPAVLAEGVGVNWKLGTRDKADCSERGWGWGWGGIIDLMSCARWPIEGCRFCRFRPLHLVFIWTFYFKRQRMKFMRQGWSLWSFPAFLCPFHPPSLLPLCFFHSLSPFHTANRCPHPSS